VDISKYPASKRYIGYTSLLLKFAHALFPELTAKITGFMMRRYFKMAEPLPSTSGNVFNTVNYGMSTNGGWNNPGKPIAYGRYIAAGLIAGLAVGMYFKTRHT
jgi:hypothetical protein